ncbi:MAG: hypothetical protein R2801_09085 [Chitinophagales bacterium]
MSKIKIAIAFLFIGIIPIITLGENNNLYTQSKIVIIQDKCSEKIDADIKIEKEFSNTNFEINTNDNSISIITTADENHLQSNRNFRYTKESTNKIVLTDIEKQNSINATLLYENNLPVLVLKDHDDDCFSYKIYFKNK